MPYIKQAWRSQLREPHLGPMNAGELNYEFSRLIVQYIQRNGLRYQQINDVVGALEGAKAEFQRRVVAPYEDKKIVENGDVYPDAIRYG